MDIRYRSITPDEFAAFRSASERAFGEHARPETLEMDQKIFPFDRSIAAMDGERFVGSGAIYSFRLTVPGNVEVGAGGVSWISVQPDYRRRGILTEIMRRQLRDVRERGEALAILFASESIIYGRFGFGMATATARYSIDTRHRRFGRHADSTGNIRLIEKDEAERTLPRIYERVRRVQPGALDMPPGWWDHYLSDPEPWWKGSSPRFYIIYENPAGQAEGYAGYRIASKWEDGFPAGALRVESIETITPGARASLWQYLLSVDLMTTVATNDLPIDEPLRFMLADPRRLRTTRFTDALWVRVVDIPGSLSGRRYRVSGEVVLDVTDPFLPENSGHYLVAGGPDGAECAPTNRDADLALEVSDLGAAYLGGAQLCTLAEAGRVRELKPGALGRADLMFSSDRTPFTSVSF